MQLDLQKVVLYVQASRYLEYVFEIFNSFYLKDAWRQLVICISLLIYSHPRPLSGWAL